MRGKRGIHRIRMRKRIDAALWLWAFAYPVNVRARKGVVLPMGHKLIELILGGFIYNVNEIRAHFNAVI